MEWYTIEFLYPDAFKKFKEVMFPNVDLISISTLKYYDTKNLYNFFDKEGIYMTIEMYNPYQWISNISLHNGYVLGPTGKSRITREDAEYEGFLECFKLLDMKLKEIN